jgi:hypothetical protein
MAELNNKQRKNVRFTNKFGRIESGSQSYQTLISLFFRFSLLSLSVCRIRKYCLCFEMTKLSSEKRKKSLFYKEKSLVGLNPGFENTKKDLSMKVSLTGTTTTITTKTKVRAHQDTNWKDQIVLCCEHTHTHTNAHADSLVADEITARLPFGQITLNCPFFKSCLQIKQFFHLALLAFVNLIRNSIF